MADRTELKANLKKIGNMTVDKFQNQLEEYKVGHSNDCQIIDNFIFDLAKALSESKE
jgi:recombinational DNA repair protein RecT